MTLKPASKVASKVASKPASKATAVAPAPSPRPASPPPPLEPPQSKRNRALSDIDETVNANPAVKRSRRTKVAPTTTTTIDAAEIENAAPATRTRKPRSAAAPAVRPAAKAATTTRKKPASAAPQAKAAKPRSARAPRSAPAPVPVVDGAAPKKTKARRERLPAIAEAPEAEPEQKPYFNPLPKVPEHVRPAPLVFVWGAGNFGQFGMGQTYADDWDNPRRNKLMEEKMTEGVFGGEGAGIQAIAGGGMHTLFLDEEGKVWSCGVNDNAALGRVTKLPPDESGRSVEDDNLFMVPHPIQTLVEEKFRAVKIEAGDSISAALSDKGELRVWGSFRAAEGELGFYEGTRNQFRPVPILNLSRKPGDVEKVSDVAAGHNHLLAMTTHGVLYAWGTGEQGQLARKITPRHKISGTVPAKVTLGKRGAHRVTAIGAGGMASFAVDEDGVLWGWGLNNLGQTGTGSLESEVPVPTKVVGMSAEELGGGARVVAMTGGEHHSLFLTSDGRVFSCGRAIEGQIGLPKDDEVFEKRNADKDHLRVPVHVPFPEDAAVDPVVAISCGVHNNAAVTKSGALLCWGAGTQGELGVKGEKEVWVPTVVVRKEGGKWKTMAVSCGGQHSVALLMKKED